MNEMNVQRPRYSELPSGNAKGVFGADDALGCLNLLTPERTVAATRLVKSGQVFSLNASVIDWNNPGFFSAGGLRLAPKHTLLPAKRAFASDDVLDGFNPQTSSQWDHFLHFGDATGKCYYNGHTATSIGIDQWAARGIAGRGVLLDVARWAERVGRRLDWRQRDLISTTDLERCADAQGLTIEVGTILLIRTGWESGYAGLSQADRAAMPSHNPICAELSRPKRWRRAYGTGALRRWQRTIRRSRRIPCRWMPSRCTDRYSVELGMPIGELWLLDRLADECATEHRYEFLLTSEPLNVPGGISSPPNALAIL